MDGLIEMRAPSGGTVLAAQGSVKMLSDAGFEPVPSGRADGGAEAEKPPARKTKTSAKG